MKIICVLDYCKTKACINRCYSFNGAIIILCRCAKLFILGYISAQEMDSKVGQLIYLLRRLTLK